METYFWLLHGLVKNAWDYRWLCSVSLNFHLYLGVDLFVILRGKHIYMRLFPRLSGINSDFEHIVCLCHRTLWVILASCLYRFSLWALQMKHSLWLEVWRRRLSKIQLNWFRKIFLWHYAILFGLNSKELGLSWTNRNICFLNCNVAFTNVLHAFRLQELEWSTFHYWISIHIVMVDTSLKLRWHVRTFLPDELISLLLVIYILLSSLETFLRFLISQNWLERVELVIFFESIFDDRIFLLGCFDLLRRDNTPVRASYLLVWTYHYFRYWEFCNALAFVQRIHLNYFLSCIHWRLDCKHLISQFIYFFVPLYFFI